MAKTGLKIGIAIVLLIVAFFAWAFLHLYLIELTDEGSALISIPIVIIVYIAIIKFLFKLIDPEDNNTDYRNSMDYRDNQSTVQSENRSVRNENPMNDNKQYYNPGEYGNIPGESNYNTKNLVLLIVIIIAIIAVILNLAGMF